MGPPWASGEKAKMMNLRETCNWIFEEDEEPEVLEREREGVGLLGKGALGLLLIGEKSKERESGGESSG